MNEYELMFCLAAIVDWYDGLPSSIRDEIEDMPGRPEWIDKANRLCAHYANINAIKAGRLDK